MQQQTLAMIQNCIKHRMVHHPKRGTRLGCPTIARKRKTVQGILRDMGENYFRRAFRMSSLTFNKFYASLTDDLREVMRESDKTCCVNGRIPQSLQVAIALRFFASGCAYDLSALWGVSHTEVFNSVDFLVDAINRSKNFKLEFPSAHEEQRKIASGFAAKSKAGFDCCCGAVDGLLIWTHQPTEEDCELLGVGQKKFHCGRKNKFGLNLQAICDADCRFLDISILYGAASSDLLAFENWSLREKLDIPGFLAAGLCLFGDNAYVNRWSMATPYPNVSGFNRQMDAYNFYHSQLRIKIECAFGMLVRRFGYLQKKAPQKHTMTKVMAVVSCLCRIHNWLIDVTGRTQAADIHPPADEDALTLALDGAVSMEMRSGNVVPTQLLDSGAHFDDDPDRSVRRRRTVGRQPVIEGGLRDSNRFDATKFPRENLCQKVEEMSLTRPSTSVLFRAL